MLKVVNASNSRIASQRIATRSATLATATLFRRNTGRARDIDLNTFCFRFRPQLGFWPPGDHNDIFSRHVLD